jgi:phosphatidylserine/phosphatidylglycerophosphate/cardiolipin synthase-like enzyme
MTNDPRNSRTKRRILYNINQAIHHTRHGEKIRIMSWNIASRPFVRELLRANSRGVSVRLLMARGKAEGQPRSTGDYWRLKRGLKHRSTSHPQPKGLHSWARTCDRSCRGKRGIAHTKAFVFTKVGGADYVVMSTSANATEVSVNYQWNDMYTLAGNRTIYRAFMKTFNEASHDRPVRPAYRQVSSGTLMAYMYPWKGANARGDRVMRELRRIRCLGVRGGTGLNHRTRIRIAQDAIIDKRGINLGWKLRRLYQAGCNIKIVYSLMGREVHRILTHTSRGAVPMRQIVQDFDGDGVYDRYLHSKVMSVSGNYAGNPAARVAWQGSENWSGLAKISDEQGFRIYRQGAEERYARWIDWLYANPPPNPYSRSRTSALRAAGIDPMRKVKANLN